MTDAVVLEGPVFKLKERRPVWKAIHVVLLPGKQLVYYANAEDARAQRRALTRPKGVLSHPVDAPLSELLAAFCAAAHPPGSRPPPKRLQISFDGDRVDGKKTPRQLELEEDDLLEVVDAR